MSLLRDFLEVAPPGTAETLAALACAESLTDSVALAIYERVSVPGLSAENFVFAFKYSGLTEPRNSEWNLAPALRQELVSECVLAVDASKAVHRMLLSLAENGENRKRAGTEVPSYLFTEAGLAYHLAGAGELEEALKHYSEASKGAFTGAQWLGANLAEEQERVGVIPAGRVETTFLRAWVLFREGQRRDAMPLFRKVAATDLEMREVAISLHILGNDNNRGQRRDSERQLRRSIEIGEGLDNQFHVAQTLHSLANLLSRQGRRFDEAEKAYQRSIKILGELDNQLGVAQTLHSLANMLSRQGRRFDEAEKAYQRSIEIDGKLDNQCGVAQTLHSLANLLSRQEGRFDEAEKAYKRSIAIGEKLRNDNHLAQVLRSYALAIESRSPDETIELLQRSLDINRRRGNQRYVRLVERTIREVRRRVEGR